MFRTKKCVDCRFIQDKIEFLGRISHLGDIHYFVNHFLLVFLLFYFGHLSYYLLGDVVVEDVVVTGLVKAVLNLAISTAYIEDFLLFVFTKQFNNQIIYSVKGLKPIKSTAFSFLIPFLPILCRSIIIGIIVFQGLFLILLIWNNIIWMFIDFLFVVFLHCFLVYNIYNDLEIHIITRLWPRRCIRGITGWFLPKKFVTKPNSQQPFPNHLMEFWFASLCEVLSVWWYHLPRSCNRWWQQKEYQFNRFWSIFFQLIDHCHQLYNSRVFFWKEILN